MFQPQVAIACSADQDCGAPRPSRAAMAFEISPNASSPLSTYMNVPAGAFSVANAKKAAASAVCKFDHRFSPRPMYCAPPGAFGFRYGGGGVGRWPGAPRECPEVSVL